MYKFCKGFVILDKSAYNSKAEAMLEDRDSYEKMQKNPVPKVEARAKRTLLNTARGKLPDRTIKELTPGHSRTPVFYGVPKDHKPSVPLRPVISACGGPTEKNIMPVGKNTKATAQTCSYTPCGTRKTSYKR